jgi:hypothetical protein
MKLRMRLLVIGAAVIGLAYTYWKLAIPMHRVEARSELVMLGDLNGDGRWSHSDLSPMETALENPSSATDRVAFRLDINQNGLIDEEDVAVLRALVRAHGDPYAAHEAATASEAFPRPRELYRYVSEASPPADPEPRA